MRKISGIIMIVLMLMFVGCAGSEKGSDESKSDGTGADALSSNEAVIKDELSSDAGNGPIEVNVKWNFGYVGSSKNSKGYENKINYEGNYYSYSDILYIEKAGTTVTFTDDNTVSDKDKKFATLSVYVVSSWKEQYGEWDIDLDAANFNGESIVVCEEKDKAMLYTYTTSKDNEYIRLCYYSGQDADYTPEAYPTVYAYTSGKTETVKEPMSEYEKHKNFMEDFMEENKYPALRGITLNVIGDSYFAGHTLETKYTWPSLLAEAYDMKYQNYGKNGSMISDYVTTNNPMVERYTQMADNDPGIVIFEGGKNDFNKNVPIDRFSADVEKLVTGLREKYPNALILAVTPWKVGGKNDIDNTVGDYADALVNTCERLGVPCFDASNPQNLGGIVDMTNSDFRAEYCLGPNDVSHLNASGHRLVLEYFEKFVGESYNK